MSKKVTDTTTAITALKELLCSLIFITSSIICILLFAASIIQVLFGAMDATIFGSCSYNSIADYGPGRMLGCFLFEKRW